MPVPGVGQLLGRIDAPFLREEIAQLRIAGLDLRARRVGGAPHGKAAAARDRRVEQLAPQLGGAHRDAEHRRRREMQRDRRVLASRPAQEAVLVLVGAAHVDALQRQAPALAALARIGQERIQRLRWQQQLKRPRWPAAGAGDGAPAAAASLTVRVIDPMSSVTL